MPSSPEFYTCCTNPSLPDSLPSLVPGAKPWGGGTLAKRAVEGPATPPSVDASRRHLPTASPQGGSIIPEAYRLTAPASPHRAAEIDGVNIDVEILVPPPGDLIVEGAGGALVPVTPTTLYADLFARWQIPVIVCAHTALGTSNHRDRKNVV